MSKVTVLLLSRRVEPIYIVGVNIQVFSAASGCVLFASLVGE